MIRLCSLWEVPVSISNDMTETQDIESLVKKCQSGDKDALGRLYQAYLEPMRKVVSFYVKDQTAVWDIIHDGFLIAFASISSLRNASKVESWLTSIMKNLAFQYLKEENGHKYVPISDETEEYEAADSDNGQTFLSWDELSKIVDKLPAGYSKVFRLAVLDGLSHKEIGAMLGIAPHSSSSHLVRAKAMLRRLLRQYYIEAGILTLFIAVLIVWLCLPAGENMKHSSPLLSRNNEKEGLKKAAEIHADTVDAPSRTNKKERSVYEILRKPKASVSDMAVSDKIKPEPTTESEAGNDSILLVSNDNVPKDTVRKRLRLIDEDSYPAMQEIALQQHGSNHEWDLSLAYAGISWHSADKKGDFACSSPGDTAPELPENPDWHHKMPVIVGVSVNKSLTSRWSIETGLRYSFMESEADLGWQPKMKRINQQIHYIGIPLKLNYRIFTIGGFSFYGHGGGALDIPLNGRQIYTDNISSKTAKYRIHVPLQWSVETGIGIQYHFSPSFSIFTEPTINYYFNPGGKIETIRQEKPLEFSLPIGLRFTW